MFATYQPKLLREVVHTSLCFYGHGYVIRSDGALLFSGVRPGPEWEGHGYFAVNHGALRAGEVRHLRLLKHRWRKKGTNSTVHSRPDDDLGLQLDALIVALMLWAVLDSALGLHRAPEVMPALEDLAARRTVARWLRRARAKGLHTQQHIRREILERCEPRPVEQLFPGGLSPPEHLARRCQPIHQTATTQLWRGLAMLLGGALSLEVPTARLLAGARGRMNNPQDTLLI